MPNQAAEKSGHHRPRSKPVHKAHRKVPEAGHGSATRKMGHHKGPSIAHHGGGGGYIGSAEADIEGLVKRSAMPTSHAKHHHHGSGARRPVADGAKKNLANAIPAAMDASEYSSIEAQELQARYDKVAIGSAVAVALVVLLIVFIAVSWYIASRKQVVEPSAMRGYSLVNILDAACITDDCRTAVTMLNSSIDPSANPCDELYKYACGKWHAVDDDGRPLSYEANVRYRYVHAVDRKLVGNATIDRLCDSGDPRAKMGCIYSSCVAFYTKTASTLEKLVAVAEIDTATWSLARDFQAMFYIFVRLIVDTGVPSVLNVIRRDTVTAVIEVGPCISCFAGGDDRFVKYLLSQAVTIKMTDSDSVKKLLDDFIHLDKLLKSVPSVRKGTPAVDANPSLFESVSRYTWLKALAGSHAGFSNNTEDLKLLSPNSKGAGQVMTELRTAKLEVARLYMLLAPVAPYMAVERFEEGQRRSAKMFTAQVKCLNNVGFLFPVPFDTTVASFLGAEKAAVTFNNLWSTTRLAGINALHIGKGYDISKDALMAASIGISETSGLDDPSFVEKYDGDFLANLMRYRHLGRTAFEASDFRSDSTSKGGFLPTQYFSPDYYYKDATEKPINSGTFGVLAAAMLFRKSVPPLASKPKAYAKCLTDYSRNTLKLNVNESDWMTLTRARWATEVALATAQPGSSLHHPKEMIAMHYMRVARGFCGELEENRVPLKFVALTSQSFDRAFECDYLFPPMSC